MTHHFISQMPLRVSALRSLGAYMNIFAIESFMDEMAVAANTDPIEFRLKHLEDTRTKDVIETALADIKISALASKADIHYAKIQPAPSRIMTARIREE